MGIVQITSCLKEATRRKQDIPHKLLIHDVFLLINFTFRTDTEATASDVPKHFFNDLIDLENSKETMVRLSFEAFSNVMIM